MSSANCSTENNDGSSDDEKAESEDAYAYFDALVSEREKRHLAAKLRALSLFIWGDDD